MKIKNLKCYILAVSILANSSFMISCDVLDKKFTKNNNRDFDEFLEENNIVCIFDLENVPYNYYEAEVAEIEKKADGTIQINKHWEKIDNIDDVICPAREFDYDYVVLKIEEKNEKYEITDKVIDKIDERPLEYNYVYADDYVIFDGYRDVLIKYGKVLKRE